jgi:HK97 family phage portal protein
MAILDFFKNTSFTKKINRAIFEYWISKGTANIMDQNFDSYIENGYNTNVDVYSIIGRVDAMRKQAPLTLFKRLPNGEKEVVQDHELLKFSRKVNKNLNTDEFISQFLIYRLLLGNMFIYRPMIKTGTDKGKCYELHPMPVNEVEILEGDWLNPVSGYKIEGTKSSFDLSEVYHSKMFNPNYVRDRSLYGMSPLRAAARIVSKQNESELTQLKQFENQSPPYLLYREGNKQENTRMSPQQIKEAEGALKKASKSTKKGLGSVLPEKYGIIKLGESAADLNILESSKDGRKVLCNVWHLPPALFGIENPTYNNIATARKSAWTDCIMPNLKEVANALNECTINNYEPYANEGLFWGFDYSQIEELQDEMKTRVEWMRKAGYSLNEIRKHTGAKKIDNALMDEPILSTQDMFLSDLDYTQEEDEKKDFRDYLD